MLRRMLRGFIVFLFGAGLVALVYTLRPDVPVDSATSRVQQPATPVGSASTGTLISTGIGDGLVGSFHRPASSGHQAPDAFAVKPISSDLHKAAIRPGRSKGFETLMGPRAELVSEPRSVGWGDSYAVRLLNSAGQPMVVSEIVLIARMEDGTVEKIAMGALPERGIYRATVPTRQSAPITLRVRVSYGEQRVEIPVRR